MPPPTQTPAAPTATPTPTTPPPSASAPASRQLTLDQFGAAIKTKFPQYSAYSNDDIARAMLDRYPQYRNAIADPIADKEFPDLRPRAGVTIGPRDPATVSADPRNALGRWWDNHMAAAKSQAQDIHTRFGSGPAAYVEDARQTIASFLDKNAPMIAGGVGSAMIGPEAGMAMRMLGAAGGGAVGGAAQYPNNPLPAAGKSAAEQAMLQLGGEAIPALVGKTIDATRFASTLRPTEEVINGVPIPQLVGERAPDSTAGILQRVLKKYGAGPGAFREVEAEQTAGTKEALRRGLERASRTPITSTEPPAAAAQAVSGLESRAKPLYNQLAASRVGIPFDQTVLGSGPEDAAWRRAVARLKVPADDLRYPNKPLYLLQEYRHELQNIALGARGTTEGYLAQEARKDLDAGIEKSLAASDPRLLRSWKTANALWARARAIDDLRGELLAVTKGTTPSAQSLQSGAAATPTAIQGSSLVERLKKLDEGSHDLARSFPDGGKSIRAVADLLDKAQKTKTADPSLFPWSRVLRYGAALIGTTGGATLATLGSGKAGSHPAVATFAAAAVLAFIGERYGEKALVALMTDKESADALSQLAEAKSTATVEAATQKLRRYLPQAIRGGAMVKNTIPTQPPAQPVQAMQPQPQPILAGVAQ
jgi:hypothetical protein